MGNESLFAGGGGWGLGHITKMAPMPIYGKNPLKIFSGTKGPMTLGLGMQHRGLGPNKVCSDDDLGLTFFYDKVKEECALRTHKFAEKSTCSYSKTFLTKG